MRTLVLLATTILVLVDDTSHASSVIGQIRTAYGEAESQSDLQLLSAYAKGPRDTTDHEDARTRGPLTESNFLGNQQLSNKHRGYARLQEALLPVATPVETLPPATQPVITLLPITTVAATTSQRSTETHTNAAQVVNPLEYNILVQQKPSFKQRGYTHLHTDVPLTSTTAPPPPLTTTAAALNDGDSLNYHILVNQQPSFKHRGYTHPNLPIPRSKPIALATTAPSTTIHPTDLPTSPPTVSVPLTDRNPSNYNILVNQKPSFKHRGYTHLHTYVPLTVTTKTTVGPPLQTTAASPQPNDKNPLNYNRLVNQKPSFKHRGYTHPHPRPAPLPKTAPPQSTTAVLESTTSPAPQLKSPSEPNSLRLQRPSFKHRGYSHL
ncbi:PREDICTED: mucin-2-like [Priapulus caudatus]|uniref:Mucin-2-like n=1 Tax=Priapulus caudatus TaxID=37621 RepID=A0ABM1EPT5_PRICU|nr:PREDICTED: mucin-2-like [Priapulus caudatus]